MSLNADESTAISPMLPLPWGARAARFPCPISWAARVSS